MTVEEWWNKVRHSECWSGAIVDTPWSELWDWAKEELKEIYEQNSTST